MKALVLEKQHDLKIRDIDLPLVLGPDDVRIRIHTVGVCGSDVHYYTHGRIGHFIVDQPMVLGHEAAGTVIEVGSNVTHLAKGDRVCMEPGIPNPRSKASRLGLYNVDPSVVFWATPPVHGCLTPEVVHPAAFATSSPTMSALLKERWWSLSPSACRQQSRHVSSPVMSPLSLAPARSA